MAAAAVVLGSCPVVFLGKNYVSPNHGTLLLYDNYPTLPGYEDTRWGDPKSSDVLRSCYFGELGSGNP